MTRRPADVAAEETSHPLPQSGGSFTVTDGVLVPDRATSEAATDPVPTRSTTPDKPAVKPGSKEV